MSAELNALLSGMCSFKLLTLIRAQLGTMGRLYKVSLLCWCNSRLYRILRQGAGKNESVETWRMRVSAACQVFWSLLLERTITNKIPRLYRRRRLMLPQSGRCISSLIVLLFRTWRFILQLLQSFRFFLNEEFAECKWKGAGVKSRAA